MSEKKIVKLKSFVLEGNGSETVLILNFDDRLRATISLFGGELSDAEKKILQATVVVPSSKIEANTKSMEFRFEDIKRNRYFLLEEKTGRQSSVINANILDVLRLGDLVESAGMYYNLPEDTKPKDKE